ncbi:MAG: YbjQ family protein [Clostridia bacterium]|nr:YbjQ family protein [Clostridia bacterium]
MILTTTEHIEGRKLETLGLVKGSTIQTVNAFRDIGAGLKTLVGGELVKYNEMMNNARALATKRMTEEAAALGADAVVGVRYGSASVMQNAAEVMAYGTAVRFKED